MKQPVGFAALAFALCIILVSQEAAYAANGEERLPIGVFTATKIKAPTIDGKIEAGEWDRALVSSGLMTPFGHKLQQAATTFGFGYDDVKFYFLARCVRGDREWKLWKSVRENDGYSFGDPSIELWVTPPTLVPETYQNVINTYPAVLDQKMIPTRGYTAQGWKGNWELGVTESDTEYIIEAAIPIKDFGFDGVKNGDVWRFLFCRTSPGTQPRAQASWSLTQGFAELGQHPTVKLMDDEAVVQLRGTETVFGGNYKFNLTLVAPEKTGAQLTAQIRWHDKPKPEGGEVKKQSVSLAAGEKKVVAFAGTRTGKGNFTITVNRKDTLLFQQSFPYEVNHWTPKKPTRPDKAREAKELDLMAQYGSESNVVILRADIIDLATREKAVGGTVRLLDPAADNKELMQTSLPSFREWYASTHFFLKGIDIPVMDFRKFADLDKQIEEIQRQNKARKKKKEKLLPVPKIPMPDAKKVVVEVTVKDQAGKTLKTATKELALRQYIFAWTDNKVGVTDKAIPPYTPVTRQGNTISVWNRKLTVNGLGLLDKVVNGGVDQVKSMRIVAVQGGKEVVIQPGAPKVTREVENEVDITGSASGAGLKLTAKSQVEFDGYVLTDLTIAPAAGSAKVDKLFLEVVLPESEATHFCTTAGGWAAVHDRTPKYWSSQQTASGMMIGDFVPYIWLTNSDRAFLWVADNDKGWITDDDKSLPTQELKRENGLVTLRLHFIEVPTELKGPTSLRYAYQTFPAKPLPKGWRTIICGQDPGNLPSAVNTYFWFDGDWAVLWPYYCSPYPWDMQKSKSLFARFPKDTTHRPCVGSIAHSVGRYRDYAGHEFNEYAVDWGSTPGDRGNANCTQGKGPIDFRVWHYQKWVKEAAFRGLYVDENYLGLEKNFLTGGAYFRADGRLQPGYSYLGEREYFKRLKVAFHQSGAPKPNLWQHISSGAAYHAWLGDVFFEGENVEPTDEKFDYIEVLPAGRMRAIGSSVCAGGVMTMMCQSQRHATQWEPKHTHQFVGWVMAHDIVPEQVRWYGPLAQAARFYQDVEFLGYWKDANPFKTNTPDCMVSTHKAGKRALIWIVNTARKDLIVDVVIDWAKLGFDQAKCVALNAETGAEVQFTGKGLSVPVLQRDFVAIHVIDPQVLRAGESFYASFDKSLEADESFGCGVLPYAGRRKAGDPGPSLVDGKAGKALAILQGVKLLPHLHFTNEHGRLSFLARIKDKGWGPVLSIEGDRKMGLTPIRIESRKGELRFGWFPKDKQADLAGKRVEGAGLAPGWHAFDLSWKDQQMTLTVDGKAVGSVALPDLKIPHGTGKALLSSSTFVFGSRRSAIDAIDEVRCAR